MRRWRHAEPVLRTGEQPVAVYAFFVLDGDGATTRGAEKECTDDAAARCFADALLDGTGQVEVWRGDERVGWVFSRPYPGQT